MVLQPASVYSQTCKPFLSCAFNYFSISSTVLRCCALPLGMTRESVQTESAEIRFILTIRILRSYQPAKVLDEKIVVCIIIGDEKQINMTDTNPS